jgi:TP901 family phage tail tape measure protein
MPDLTSRLILELIDRLSVPAGAAAKSLKQVEDSAKNIGKGVDFQERMAGQLRSLQGQAKQIQTLKTQMGDFSSTRQAFAEARRNVEQLARLHAEARAKMADFGDVKLGRGDKSVFAQAVRAQRGELKDLEAQLNVAKRMVKRAAAEVDGEIGKMKGATARLGIGSFSDVNAREQEVLASIRRVNAELQRQRQLMPGGGRGGGGPAVPGGVPPGGGGRPITGGGSPLRIPYGGLAGGYGVWQAGQYAYDYEKAKNYMAARSGWSEAEAQAFNMYARQYAVQSGRAPGGPKGIMDIGENFGKSGLSMPAAKGSAPAVLDFARFGDISEEDAAKYIISAATQFKKPMGTVEEAKGTSRYFADLMSYIANKTQGDVRDVGAGFKYAAPYAAALGISPEQLAAAIGVQLKGGLRGDDAGVALRSMMVKMVKPTQDGGQAMAELGLNIGDYVTTMRPFTPKEASAGIRSMQGKLKPGSDERLQTRMDSLQGASFEKVQAELVDFFNEETGANTVQDKSKISKWISRFLSSQIEELDIDSLFTDLDEKGATPGHLARIFDARHAAKMLLLKDREAYDELLAGTRTEAPGSAARGGERASRGIVGAWSRFTSSVQDFVVTLGESGLVEMATVEIQDAASLVKEVKQFSQTGGRLGRWWRGEAGPSDSPMGTAMNGRFGRRGGDIAPPDLGAVMHQRERDAMAAARRDASLRHSALRAMGGRVALLPDQASSPPMHRQAGGGRYGMNMPETIQPKVEVQGVETAKADTSELTKAFQDLSAVTATPSVVVQGIDAMLAKVAQLKAAILNLPSLSGAAAGLHGDAGIAPGAGQGGGGW